MCSTNFNMVSSHGLVLYAIADYQKNVPIREIIVEGCIEAMGQEDSEIQRELMSVAVGFAANYVSKIYGQRFIDGWMRKNKGRRFIDMITMSDLAYCIALVENYHEVWIEEIEVRKKIEQLPQNERIQFDRKKLTKSMKEKFLGRDPKVSKFALKKGNGKKYMSHG